jgi:hypothetical protein
MASQFVQLPVVGGGGIDWSTPVDANIVPDANFAYDLGASATAEFYHVWANKLSTGFANGNIDLEAFDGRIQLYAASANGGEVSVYDISNVAAIPLRLYANNQSDFVGFVAPATTTSNVTYVLPSADGTSGQVLQTNGSGVLSWATAGGSVDWANVNSDINFDTAFGYQIGNNRPPFNIYSGIFSATDSSFYQQLEVLAQDSPSGEHPNLPNLRAIIRSTYGSDIGIITTQDSITNTGDSSNFGVITGNVTTGTDNTGGLFLRSGNSTGGNSGNLELLVGTAGGTQGDIRLHKIGTTVTVGHVWTATSTNGKGYWAAAPSGGSSAGSNGAIQFSNGAGGFLADSSKLYWDNTNDRLGIGTATPLYDLHVENAGGGFLGHFKTNGGGCLIRLVNDTNIEVVLNSQSGTSKVGTNTNHDFYLTTNNINRVQIAAGGDWTFNGNTGKIDASAATGPLRLPNLASDPGSPLNGDMWYNTTSNQLKARVNGVTVVIA